MEELIIKYDKKVMELKHEIERLTQEVTYERKMRNFMMDKSFEYVERIDKATEYIEGFIANGIYTNKDSNYMKLLYNIKYLLKGEDNE